MVKHSRGYRTRCRSLLRLRLRERRISWISKVSRTFNVGDRVHIVIDPRFIRTAPHRRFHGRTGTIVGKRGKAYVIEVYLGDKLKTVITTPEHLALAKA